MDNKILSEKREQIITNKNKEVNKLKQNEIKGKKRNPIVKPFYMMIWNNCITLSRDHFGNLLTM